MTLVQQFLALFFPEVCLLCKKPKSSVCVSCLAELSPYLNKNQSLPNFISPVFSYKDPNVKKLIWAFKYSKKRQLASPLAHSLKDTVEAIVSELYELRGAREILILPIPLHPKRLRTREYNQSDLLVKEILKLTQDSILIADYSVIIRNKMATPNAKSHSKRERELNTTGSFEVISPEKVCGRHVLLVDDVVTTGTTLSEARKVLIAAGACSVSAITVAH